LAKKRDIEVDESIEDANKIHEYKCLRCGKSWKNPVGHFYKSKYSQLFIKNSRYSTLCRDCVDELFTMYENKYGTNTACILMLYKLDIPYSYSLYNSVVTKNNVFNIGMYLRQASNLKQMMFQDFSQSILSGEISKSKDDFEEEKEVKWSEKDKKNRDFCIDVVGYDPFYGYPEEDRKFLFNQLMLYLDDDDIAQDPYKLSQILQIINNNKQIKQLDIKIANLDPLKDVKDISSLNSIKNSLVSNNDKIAKENEISVKNRSNKDAGKSTLTYLMRELRGLKFDKVEENYYNQLRSEGTQWAANVSQKSMLEHCMFDESDKREVYQNQLDLINNLYKELDDTKEQIRLLKIENDSLKSHGIEVADGVS
jgi:hypothetical protein